MPRGQRRDGQKLGATAAVLCVTVWASQAQPAQACSSTGCRSASAFPSHGELPQNLLQLRVTPPYEWMADGGVFAPHLYRVDEDRRTELALTVSPLTSGDLLLLPVSTPEVGTKLVLEGDHSACAPLPPLHAEFVVTNAVTVPAELGSLAVALGRSEVAVPTNRGSCTIPLDSAFAALTLTPSLAARPIIDVIERHLWVDGVDFGDVQRVYATCEPFDDPWANDVNLKLGKHRAELRGLLLDGTMSKTSEVEFELHCDSDAGAPSVSTHDAGDTEDTGATAAALDAGSGSADAAAVSVPRRADGSVAPFDASSPGIDSVLNDDGCSLAVQPRARGTWAAWLGLVVVLRRMRRRRN